MNSGLRVPKALFRDFEQGHETFPPRGDLQPTRGHVYVSIDQVQRVGLIWVPQKVVQTGAIKFAHVIACHPSFTEETGVNPGDRVLLDNFVREHYPKPEDRLKMLISEHDVIALVKPD